MFSSSPSRATLESRFRLAAMSICALLIVGFVSFGAGPFRAEGDVAYVAKAAQQFVSFGTPFNRLRLVDPCDLSRDVDTWIFWWPPAICAALASLLSAGLTIGTAARILMVTAAVAGSLGWARVAAHLLSTRLALVLSAAPSLLYVVNNEMFGKFSSGDPIVFATIPWLFVLALRIFERPLARSSERESVALGLACGGMYWIKYSALFGAAAVMASVFCVMIMADRSPRKMLVLALSGLAFLAPIASLWLLNRAYGGDFIQSSLSAAVPFENLPDALLRATAMAVLPIENGVDRLLFGQLLPLLARLVSLAVAAVVVLAAWRRWGLGAGLLAGLLIVVPVSVLGYLTWASGYAFLLDANRHAGAYWPFLQLVLLALLVGENREAQWRGGWLRKIAVVGVAVLFCFAAYTPYVALSDARADAQSDQDAKTGLLYPTLSQKHSGALALKIRSRLEAGDVVVPASYWQGMDSWLAFDQRLLPLTNFYQPLVATHGLSGANYRAAQPLRSSKPVHVTLVLTDPYSDPMVHEWNERIKRRFDQAGEWVQLPLEGTNTTIWSAVLTSPMDSATLKPPTICP